MILQFCKSRPKARRKRNLVPFLSKMSHPLYQNLRSKKINAKYLFHIAQVWVHDQFKLYSKFLLIWKFPAENVRLIMHSKLSGLEKILCIDLFWQGCSFFKGSSSLETGGLTFFVKAEPNCACGRLWVSIFRSYQDGAYNGQYAL